MRYKLVLLFVLSLVLFGDFSLNAQSYPIQITLIKKPPHLMKFDDYEDFSNQIFISAVNTSANKVEFNLNFNATGPNGLTVNAENFLDEPIVLGPGEVLSFDGSQFEDYGVSGLSENNIQPESERKYLAYSRVLREGRYTFCLTAIVPNSPKKFLSDPNEGCDYFDTKYGEPPFIVTPDNNEAVTATDPAILNVVWTHNTIGAPSAFDYTLKIVDITKFGDYDPIEVIEQPGVPVIFEDAFEGQFFAGLTDIDLEEGHRYAMRVTVKDPEDNMKFQNAGKSNVVVFNYQKQNLTDPIDTTTTIAVNDDDTSQDSTNTSNEPPVHAGPSECDFIEDAPTLTSSVATSSLSVGDVLTIGRFSMEVKSSTAGPNNTFTGTGEIAIPFLNNIKILTNFTNIQKNADNQIFEGVVTGKEDRSFPYAAINTGIGMVPGMTAEQKDQLKDFLATGNRLLSLYNGNETIGLPIGIDNEVADNSVTVGIMKMTFTPFGANLDAMMSVNIPSLEDNMLHDLSLGVMDLSFSPEGLSPQAKLYLGRDLTVSESNGNELIFGGLEDAGTDWNQITFAEWDCSGFKCLNVALDYKFSRDVIVPDSPDGSPGDGFVQAHTNITLCNDFNMLAQIDIPAFQIAGSPDGFAFEVDEAWIDYSTIGNIEGLTENLPANYNSPTLSSGDPRVQNTWKGFWMKDLKLRIPEYAGNVHGDERTMSAQLHNFIYDGQFTFTFRVENLMNLSANHDLEGSSFSIDTIYMDVVQNDFEQAAMKGKIGLPVSGENEYLNYKLLFDEEQEGDTLQFVIQPRNGVTLPMFLAEADILPSSSFKLLIEPEVKFMMDLNAKISISDRFNPGSIDLGPLSVEIPNVMIEHLAYNSKTGFDDSHFTYSPASPQKNMAGFPLTLDGFSFSFNNFNPTITLTPKLTLTSGEDGISATTSITFKSALRPKAAGIKKIELTSVDLTGISIDAHISTIGLKGSLEFYNEHGAKGTRGELNVTLPAGISARLAADFGTYKNASIADPEYNTAQWYDYWYVDGLVGFGEAGIPVFSGLSLYGLGGGVSRRMTKTGSLPNISASAGEAPQPSGGVYRPDFNTALGLNFKAIFGSSDGGRAFNFDVTLGAEFSDRGGMTSFGFAGNVRSMAKDLNDSDTPITGYVSVSYHNPGSAENGEEHIEGQLFMTANFYDVIKGGTTISNPPADYTGPTNNAFVWASFYTAMNRDYWYFNMGTPTNRGKLNVAGIATFSSYLMVGHDVPPTLPSPPQSFMDIYENQEDGIAGGGDVSSLMAGASRPALPPGSGFAFGSYYEVSVEGSPSIFYYDIGMVIGYDINLTHNVARTCAEYGSSPGVPQVPGVNNWYATGQFYAGIHGEFGVDVDLMFYHGRYTILDASAAILLQGGLPNPVWASGGGRIRYNILHGAVKGTYSFEANIGHKCTPSISSSGMLDAMSFIQDMTPAEGSVNVDVTNVGAAVFAIEVNEILEIPVDNGIRRFRPYISSWTLKERGGANVLCNNIELNEENIMATMMPQDILKPQTRYVQSLEVKVKELFANGTSQNVKKPNGHDWSEIKINGFKTGNAPTTIPEQSVMLTYPLQNQKHFLKGETENGYGYVVLKQGMSYLFPEYGDASNHYEYIARFTPIDAGEETHIDLPLETNDFRILKFNVSALQNNTAYSVQIISKRNPTPEEQMNQMIAGLHNSQLAHTYTIDINQQDINVFNINGSTATYRKRTLPGNISKNTNEKILYNYYFQTSRFNTFEQKANAMTWEASQRGSRTSVESVHIEATTIPEYPEAFDTRPFQKATSNRTYTVGKLIKLVLNEDISTSDAAYAEFPANKYYTNIYKRFLFSRWIEIRSRVSSDGYSRNYIRRLAYNWDNFNHITLGGPSDSPLTDEYLNNLLGNTTMYVFYMPYYSSQDDYSVHVNQYLHSTGKAALQSFKNRLAYDMEQRHFFTGYQKLRNVVSSSTRSMYYQIIHTPTERMAFPRTNTGRLMPVSFIMQYRYPRSSTSVSSSTISMEYGTKARVVTGYFDE